MKSYKEMKYTELVEEENRVKNLLATNKNYFTYNQNKKYLAKVQAKRKLLEKQQYGV